MLIISHEQTAASVQAATAEAIFRSLLGELLHVATCCKFSLFVWPLEFLHALSMFSTCIKSFLGGRAVLSWGGLVVPWNSDLRALLWTSTFWICHAHADLLQGGDEISACCSMWCVCVRLVYALSLSRFKKVSTKWSSPRSWKEISRHWSKVFAMQFRAPWPKNHPSLFEYEYSLFFSLSLSLCIYATPPLKSLPFSCGCWAERQFSHNKHICVNVADGPFQQKQNPWFWSNSSLNKTGPFQ